MPTEKKPFKTRFTVGDYYRNSWNDHAIDDHNEHCDCRPDGRVPGGDRKIAEAFGQRVPPQKVVS